MQLGAGIALLLDFLDESVVAAFVLLLELLAYGKHLLLRPDQLPAVVSVLNLADVLPFRAAAAWGFVRAASFRGGVLSDVPLDSLDLLIEVVVPPLQRLLDQVHHFGPCPP